jgi:hypothetical protein
MDRCNGAEHLVDGGCFGGECVSDTRELEILHCELVTVAGATIAKDGSRYAC